MWSDSGATERTVRPLTPLCTVSAAQARLQERLLSPARLKAWGWGVERARGRGNTAPAPTHHQPCPRSLQVTSLTPHFPPLKAPAPLSAPWGPVIQKIAEEGKLPNSFYEATITLIPKPDKDTTHQTRKLQAVSPMNIDAKSSTKH